MFSKRELLSLIVLVAVAVPLVGCGNDTPPPPKGAMRPPSPPPPSTKTTWSKQDKIDAVQKSGMSPEQKKQMIDKLNAEG